MTIDVRPYTGKKQKRQIFIAKNMSAFRWNKLNLVERESSQHPSGHKHI